jgi:predicted alpha/beta-fold hydrolase
MSAFAAAPPFSAPLWLKTGHLQTAYTGLFWTPPPLPALMRCDIPVDAENDNQNQVRCLLNRSHQDRPAAVLVILVHGLEGHAEVPYMLSTARKLLSQGLDVLRMNLRGCGQTQHLSRTSYHAGLSGDVRAVAEYAAAQLGYEQIVLAGYSLGGHQVLKLATEWTSPPAWLKGICAVSPPLDLGRTSHNLLRLENRGYERYFFRLMLASYRARRRLWPEVTPLEPLARVHSLLDFDQYITGPQFGYRDAQDYYTQNSVGPHLGKITLPVQIILAQDDPIVPFSSHQAVMSQAAPSVRWLLSREGGHVAFVNSPLAARQDRDAMWSENRLLDFVAEVCEAA